MVQKHFFSSYGNHHYELALRRLEQEATSSGWFHQVCLFRPADLTPTFKLQYQDVLSMPRGGGFWIWKIDILLQVWERMSANDILVYCDAGCTINHDGKRRYLDYISMVNESPYGVLAFQMSHHLEWQWTNQKVFEYFQKTHESPEALTGQLVGGIFIMRQCAHAYHILLSWKNALQHDKLLFTDEYNHYKKIPGFIDHRHDQSIFSMACKIQGGVLLEDETWSDDWPTVSHIPFLATRYRR